MQHVTIGEGTKVTAKCQSPAVMGDLQVQTADVPVHGINDSAVLLRQENRIALSESAMKKVELNVAKLQLHKDKVSNLTNEQMNEIKGGGILWSLIGCCQSVVEPPQTSRTYDDSQCICTPKN
ncbi:class I lanthipeptide [Taibaiella soli]|uniref:Uncharacterized protein n=1 Tax=Taibaiella soli TaxID=1649169 RepID=A0A2W2B2C6_9BACT|nr:class I lanthipeptide [Taibaiella soli]PZF74424.1 hypothetical protein DN068_02265 [Taibaiella soli]